MCFPKAVFVILPLIISAAPETRLTYTYDKAMAHIPENAQTVFFQVNKTLELKCDAVKGTPTPKITWHWQRCDYATRCQVDEGAWEPFPDTLV